MLRTRNLVAINVCIFLLGQVYVIYLLVTLPAPHSLSILPSKPGARLALSAQACNCHPATAWNHRGFCPADLVPDFANTPISAGRPPAFYAPTDTAPLPPLVSVIIPYYNSANTIRDTIASVLQQSLQWFEVIIVDDASPEEKTPLVLAALTKLDVRIRVQRQEKNGGLAATRNAGAAIARGEFLYFLDADDLIEPLTLEISAWYLRSRPTHAFVGGWTVGFGAQEYIWERGFDDPSVFTNENVVTATKMVRREHFFEVGGFDAQLKQGNEDWEFWLRMANASRWGHTIAQRFDWYRRKPRTQSAQEWASWTEQGKRDFLTQMTLRYPRLYRENIFPRLKMEPAFASAKLWNPLYKDLHVRRLLFVSTPRPGDASRRSVLLRLAQCGWQLTVCLLAHDPVLAAEDITTDYFTMASFVAMPLQLAPFIVYLTQSRKSDVLVAHASLMPALQDALRRGAPNVTLVLENEFLTTWTCSASAQSTPPLR